MPIDPSDQYQQDEQRHLNEARLCDEERRERERLDRDANRGREGKADRGSGRGGWRSLFGLRRAQTEAPHVELALNAVKPSQAPAQTPLAAPAVAPIRIGTRSAGRGRAAVSVGVAALAIVGVLGFTTWQRAHSRAALIAESLATADAPALPAEPAAPPSAAVPQASRAAIAATDVAPAPAEAAAALPAPDSTSGDSTSTGAAEPPTAVASAAAPADAPTRAAEQPDEPTGPSSATADSTNAAPTPDAEAATPVVVASAISPMPDATVSALASAARDTTLANATNQIAALKTRVEALQAQLLALETAQQAAKAMPPETAPAATQPTRPRKPVRKAARAPAHEAPEPTVARAEPKLLAIDSWGGKPSVVVGIKQADGSADTRIRTLQPGDTLSGITLRSVDAEAGQAVFDVGGGHAVTLNLEPR